MDTCPLCAERNLETDPERSMQACRVCAHRIGVVPIPPARRPRVPCRACKGLRFLHALPREHTTLEGQDANHQVSAPMFVTHQPRTEEKGWLVARPHLQEISISSGHGRLEIYICVGCGLVEWHCHDVSSIPIHPHLMTEIVDYTSETPYR